MRDHDVTAEDFASLRLARAGADKVSLELEHEFQALSGLLIDEGYGMTEVGLATLNPPRGPIKQGSIGRPVGGFAVCVRDEERCECASDTVGRVWIRTRSQTIGYWENPEATAEILRDGWLDSGDLARADGDGYLWFFGRKKQIIVHDGSNISPGEVEEALAEHPAVALVGVVGIHDEVHGENVRAYVTIKDGAERPTSHELVEFARERIGYKAPDEVVFLDEMPVNPTGKLDLALGCAAVLGLGLASTAPASAAPSVDPNGRYTAEEIHTFLGDFYGDHGPGDFARKYGISEHLKEKVAQSEGLDVLLCAQNEPRSIDIGPVSTAQSTGVGYATVTTHWGEQGEDTATFTAYVGLDATRPIQLQDTDCEATV